MLVEYYRIRGDVQPPERANPSDAGLDLKYNPVPKGFMPNPEVDKVIIDPGDSVVLPTGYRFGIPHGFMLEIKNRSGMAAKKSLVVGACVVDSGYDGEVFVNLVEHTEGMQLGVSWTAQRVGRYSICAGTAQLVSLVSAPRQPPE